MDPNDSPDHDLCPRNGQPKRKRPIDRNAPQGPAPADAVERFRKLLAELIARQIVAKHHKPPTSGRDEQP